MTATPPASAIGTLHQFLWSRTRINKKRRRLLAFRRFEEAIKSSPPGSFAFDCGANVGSITSKFLNSGLRVVAFEPDKFAREILERNYGSNTNLEVVPAAVGIRNDTALLRRHKRFESNPAYLTISSSIVDRPNVDDQNSEEVRVINLIDKIKKFQGEISILKLDIEGSEVPILQSMLDSGLHQKVKFIFVETHERFSHKIAWQTAQLRARIKKGHLSHINLDHN